MALVLNITRDEEIFFDLPDGRTVKVGELRRTGGRLAFWVEAPKDIYVGHRPKTEPRPHALAERVGS